jgi:hypothetical protein
VRVTDVPHIKTSRGTTKITLEGAWVFNEPSSARASEPRSKATHEGDAGAFGVVFVNDIAREVMSSEKAAKFPEGSIIVREKLARAEDAQPELIAVMYKRARGFNPAAGDWEFLTVDGAMTKIQVRQKKGSCLECHAAQRDRDFVFQTHLSK